MCTGVTPAGRVRVHRSHEDGHRRERREHERSDRVGEADLHQLADGVLHLVALAELIRTRRSSTA